jgi:PAS domain S-box-containing protein
MNSVHLQHSAKIAIERAHNELRQSEEQFRLLVGGVKDYAIFMLDQAGNVVSWNTGAEQIKGYRAEEILGRHFSCFYPREDIESEKPERELVSAAKDGRFEEEGWRLRKDGSRFWASVVITALRDKSGVLRGFAKVSRDITKRVEAEVAEKKREALERRAEELKRSSDELQQFAYVAAHDLQEPLRMVISYTQLLARRYKGRLDADADEFVSFAVDGGHRMQLLVQGLLAYCHVGTKGKDLRETSSGAALEEALVKLRGAIEDSGGVVTHDPMPTITADSVQLVQLFQNLVGNAIKYHGVDPPRVHVSAKRNRDSEWIFSIHDNGIGIDSQYFERIFVMYQRLHGQNRKEISGIGIGLALCKKIAERHGGRVWVESALGNGSTFYVALPDGEVKTALDASGSGQLACSDPVVLN